MKKHGELPEWTKGPDCNSGGAAFGWFESTAHHFYMGK